MSDSIVRTISIPPEQQLTIVADEFTSGYYLEINGTFSNLISISPNQTIVLPPESVVKNYKLVSQTGELTYSTIPAKLGQVTVEAVEAVLPQVSVGAFQDVDLTDIEEDQILQWDGQKFVAADMEAAVALEDLEFQNIRYVAKNGDDSEGDGSLDKPFLTIQAAIDSISGAEDDFNRFGVVIMPGKYEENITLTRSINLYGPVASSELVRIEGDIVIIADSTPTIRVNFASLEIRSSTITMNNTSGTAGVCLFDTCSIASTNATFTNSQSQFRRCIVSGGQLNNNGNGQMFLLDSTMQNNVAFSQNAAGGTLQAYGGSYIGGSINVAAGLAVVGINYAQSVDYTIGSGALFYTRASSLIFANSITNNGSIFYLESGVRINAGHTAANYTATTGQIAGHLEGIDNALADKSEVDELTDLSDVDLDNVQDEQILQYDANEEKWVNVDLPASATGVEELDDLDDVTLDNVQENDVLIADDQGNFSNQQLAAVAYSNDYEDLDNLPEILDTVVTQIIHVDKSGDNSEADGSLEKPYLTVQAAIDSITDATASKKYSIKIHPGSYSEAITLKPYVNLLGQSKETVRITSASAMTLSAAGRIEVKDISISCPINIDSSGFASGTVLDIVHCNVVGNITMNGRGPGSDFFQPREVYHVGNMSLTGYVSTLFDTTIVGNLTVATGGTQTNAFGELSEITLRDCYVINCTLNATGGASAFCQSFNARIDGNLTVNNDYLVELDSISWPIGTISTTGSPTITRKTTANTVRANRTAVNYTASDESVKGHLDGIDDALANIGNGGAEELNDLTDVTITDVQDNEVLQYDESSERWVNATLEIPTSDSLEFTVEQTAHGLDQFDVVRLDGSNYIKAQADSVANAEAVGFVKEVIDSNNFILQIDGHLTGLSSLTPGTVYFLSSDTAGALTATEPALSKPMLIADTATSGIILEYRGLQISGNGNGVSELDDLDDVTLDDPQENQVLTFDGDKWVNSVFPGTPPGQEGGGALEYISSQEITSATATVDFTNLTGYDSFMIVFREIAESTTNNNSLVMAVSSDGGGSYDSNANYPGYMQTLNSAGNLATVNMNVSLGCLICPTVRYISAQGAHGYGTILLRNAGGVSSGRPRLIEVRGTSSTLDGSLNLIPISYWGGAQRGNINPVNAIRFRMSSGNILSGKFILYGIKES